MRIAAVDGSVETPPSTAVSLELRDGVLVGVPERSLPPLTVDHVRATVEQTRR
jgi:hypothetical protein